MPEIELRTQHMGLRGCEDNAAFLLRILCYPCMLLVSSFSPSYSSASWVLLLVLLAWPLTLEHRIFSTALNIAIHQAYHGQLYSRRSVVSDAKIHLALYQV
jgi:hypothetical protein